ncbi:hypothetical protein F5884DRAFT_726929 [Xylogone sp. PMI_703]|nr:hypothetical protein F5884DRAFT_726929 [Xylogone sp. PMI_703]
MCQYPSHPDDKVMDPSVMYYSRLRTQQQFHDNLPDSQGDINGPDALMTGIFNEGTMGTFEGVPVKVEAEDRGSTNQFAANSSITPQNDIITTEEDTRTNISISSNLLNTAGPSSLQAKFSPQSKLTARNTLPDFCREKNWPQRVVGQLKDVLHVLTSDGRILYSSPSSQYLLGYPQIELVGKFIVDFIHPDDSGIFVQEFNESIVTGNALHFFYRFRRKDGSYGIFESNGHPHLTSDAALGPNNTSGSCQGFFMMAKPYPTKNAALLDSFLEHKIENERLTKRIKALKKEEAEDAEDMQRYLLEKNGTLSGSGSGSGDVLTHPTTLQPSKSNPDAITMQPPTRSATAIPMSVREETKDSTINMLQETIKDKIGAGNTDIIEMFTGLKYREGERSYGLSTGDTGPTVIKSDSGNSASSDRDAKINEKKKKVKIPDEYVCTDCGTLDSPEWRKGPSGPKTLCNACGLRWAKKEKKNKTHDLAT